MRRPLPHHDRQQHCEFMQQDERGRWQCRLLQFSALPVAIVTRRGRLEWATSAAHHILRHYWSDHHPLETRLPLKIRHWINKVRKKVDARNGVTHNPTPLVIHDSIGQVVVRCIENGAYLALVFEENLFDVAVDRLVSLGLTPREAEVLRWLMQGKSIPEIAAILSISPRTVSKLLTRVYRQLGVENRHAAVATALEALRLYKYNSPKAFRQVRR